MGLIPPAHILGKWKLKLSVVSRIACPPGVCWAQLFARRKVVELQVTEWGRAGNQDTHFLFMELPEQCAWTVTSSNADHIMTQSCNDLTTLHGVVSEVVTVSSCGTTKLNHSCSPNRSSHWKYTRCQVNWNREQTCLASLLNMQWHLQLVSPWQLLSHPIQSLWSFYTDMDACWVGISLQIQLQSIKT